jgi:hypothetical protein
MFESIISDANSSAGSFVAKYLARASVVVPFAIALGFATASVSLILSARFGHTYPLPSAPSDPAQWYAK